MTRLIVIGLFFALCLLGVTGGVRAGSPPLTLVLPDPGTYAYWIQSKDGTISTLPITVSEKQVVKITEDMTTGDHLLVLDSHTGGIAARNISLGLNSKPLPIQVKLSDFHPVPLPPPPAALTSTTPPTPTSPTPSSPASTETGSDTGLLLTGVVSLMLALGVLWLLIHLVRTRGEPLLKLARQAGIETPDPAPVTSENTSATVIYTPTSRAPEKVPEGAGLEAAPSPRVQRGPEVALNGVAALIGIQGLVAGSTFAMTDGDVIIGRDGGSGIILAENTVSRRHARLFRDSSGRFVITDLGSANGVLINGMRVQRAILNSGDEIKIGDNYFRFQAAKEQ